MPFVAAVASRDERPRRQVGAASGTGIASDASALLALVLVTAVWGITFVQAEAPLAVPTWRTCGLCPRVRPTV